MIITKTPLRITLAGGGTDLPIFSKKRGGFVLTSSIDKFVYVAVREINEPYIRFTGTYFKENVRNSSKIKNHLVRNILKYMNIKSNLDIVAFADIKHNSGLGSSSSFCVGLLKALFILKKINHSYKKIAETAVFIERVLLKDGGGIQDQYIASYGRALKLTITKKSKVNIQVLKKDYLNLQKLQKYSLFFNTGIYRKSYEIQKYQNNNFYKKNNYEKFDSIKLLGKKSYYLLKKGKIKEYGHLLNEYWKIKKSTSNKISNNTIDKSYETASKNGAIGGKLLGAGGGGVLMFIAPVKNHKKISLALGKLGLNIIHINFYSNPTEVMNP